MNLNVRTRKKQNNLTAGFNILSVSVFPSLTDHVFFSSRAIFSRLESQRKILPAKIASLIKTPPTWGLYCRRIITIYNSYLVDIIKISCLPELRSLSPPNENKTPHLWLSSVYASNL